jgi:flavin-dependent dehydrogenase
VLERFTADSHLPCYGNVSAWGSPEAHCTDFIFSLHGHGWHLDRTRFDAMLRDEARNSGAAVLSEARLMCVHQEGNGWRLAIRAGEARQHARELHSAWLIDATGRSAAVGRRLGARRIHEDHLVAFYARFRPADGTVRDEDSRTFIESVPDGWWYTALIPSGERVVALLTDSDLADRTALQSVSGFMDLLQGTTHVGPLLARHGYRPDGDPRGADAGTARLFRCAGAGWLAAGDAALAFDPLSSQGILNALYMGTKAGQAIAHALCGDADHIDAYVQQAESIYAAYRSNRHSYYAAETRWRGRPFWHRRAAAH